MVNPETKYGLLGKGISHSFSAEYFNDKFKREGINASYSLHDLKDINEFRSLLRSIPNLKGLNVTSPYKRAIIPFLDGLTAPALSLNAVNSIKITQKDNGEFSLLGHNTDAEGFKISLEKLRLPDSTKAMILGTGGAASAVGYVLASLKIEFIYVSRSPSLYQGFKHTNSILRENQDFDVIGYEKASYMLPDYKLIVNATPIGMWPNVEKIPPLCLDGISADHFCYDLIYNPLKTRFLQESEAKGAKIINGMEMLINQAELSWRFWSECGDDHDMA